MTRSDERKQLHGAGMARSPGAARAAEAAEERAEKSPSEDHAGKPEGHEGENSSMARSPGAAKSATAKEESHQRSEMHEGATSVSSGRAPKSKSVESEHVFGDKDAVEAKGAEGITDMASSKGNRRENEEPERERDEKAAMSGRTVRHSGTVGGDGAGGEAKGEHLMGHGFRETVAKNTI